MRRTRNLYTSRILVYGCLLIPLGAMQLIDAIPTYGLLHAKLKRVVDPVLDKSGLWQGSWALFAPVPDHVNIRVSAKIHCETGRELTWRQPDWAAMSPLQKTTWFRQMSYFDNLRLPHNESACKSFCDSIAHDFQAKGVRPTGITLLVSKDIIAPPDDEWRSIGGSARFRDSRVLFEWRAE